MTGNEEKYRGIALDLLKKYIDSEQTVIYEYSGNFTESAMYLKTQVMGYLQALGYGEEKFVEITADSMLFERLNDEDAR